MRWDGWGRERERDREIDREGETCNALSYSAPQSCDFGAWGALGLCREEHIPLQLRPFCACVLGGSLLYPPEVIQQLKAVEFLSSRRLPKTLARCWQLSSCLQCSVGFLGFFTVISGEFERGWFVDARTRSVTLRWTCIFLKKESMATNKVFLSL